MSERLRSVGETSHVTPRSACPSCGKVMDRASMLNGDNQPSPGDITLCIGCGHIMAFADDLSYRELTDQEIIAVAGDRRIVQAQALLASYRKSRGRGQPPVR